MTQAIVWRTRSELDLATIWTKTIGQAVVLTSLSAYDLNTWVSDERDKDLDSIEAIKTLPVPVSGVRQPWQICFPESESQLNAIFEAASDLSEWWVIFSEDLELERLKAWLLSGDPANPLPAVWFLENPDTVASLSEVQAWVGLPNMYDSNSTLLIASSSDVCESLADAISESGASRVDYVKRPINKKTFFSLGRLREFLAAVSD